MGRFLTKSKFKIALECPAKLYYSTHPQEYANSKVDDPFLAALAKGGFQVGELAKCYYPDGHETEFLFEQLGLIKKEGEALHMVKEILKDRKWHTRRNWNISRE